MKISKICILGGSGFVGRHIVTQLANQGYQCRIPTRRPHRHRNLQVLLGVELTEIRDFSTSVLGQQFDGCDAVINLIGILNATKTMRFQDVHVELVNRIVDAAHSMDVKRLLHMSALNANESSGTSRYLRTKGEGENRAHTRGKPHIAVTSFRPSVIFGEDDSFINRFHQLIKFPSPLPLACPGAQFAPVYVGDVVKAFVNALENETTFGNSYELCGPRVFTLREIVDYIAWHSKRHKNVIELNDTLSKMQAKILGVMPGKPFTMDNYLSLQTPSTCTQNGLAELGIKATDMDLIVPDFLNA